MKKLLLILIIAVSLFSNLNAQSKREIDVREQGSILRFYPNPAVSVISFDFQKPYDKGYSLQIYNFLGRKMYELMNVSDHTTINLSDFTRGVYIYQLLDKTGKIVESGKFQVSK